MLRHIEQLARKDASRPPVIKQEAVNPESIERVRDIEVKGIDERCVEILVDGEWIKALGTVQEFSQRVNAIAMGIDDGGG